MTTFECPLPDVGTKKSTAISQMELSGVGGSEAGAQLYETGAMSHEELMRLGRVSNFSDQGRLISPVSQKEDFMMTHK